jgi:hypothetical protein
MKIEMVLPKRTGPTAARLNIKGRYRKPRLDLRRLSSALDIAKNNEFTMAGLPL